MLGKAWQTQAVEAGRPTQLRNNGGGGGPLWKQGPEEGGQPGAFSGRLLGWIGSSTPRKCTSLLLTTLIGCFLRRKIKNLKMERIF